MLTAPIIRASSTSFSLPIGTKVWVPTTLPIPVMTIIGFIRRIIGIEAMNFSPLKAMTAALPTRHSPMALGMEKRKKISKFL